MTQSPSSAKSKFLSLGIVLFFIAFFLFVFGEKGIPVEQNKADKMFLGGTIITVDDNNPEAQAIAVHDGKIHVRMHAGVAMLCVLQCGM